jgi:hypothetical protein
LAAKTNKRHSRWALTTLGFNPLGRDGHTRLQVS